MIEVGNPIETEESIPRDANLRIVEVFKTNVGLCLAVGTSNGIFYFDLKTGKSLSGTNLKSELYTRWNVACLKNMPFLNCIVSVIDHQIVLIHYNEDFRVEKGILKKSDVYSNKHGICVENEMIYYLKDSCDHLVVFNSKTRKIVKTMEFDDFNDSATHFEIYMDSSVFPKHIILRISKKIKIIDTTNFSVVAETSIRKPQICFDHKSMFCASIGKKNDRSFSLDDDNSDLLYISFDPVSKSLSTTAIHGEERKTFLAKPFSFYGKECFLGVSTEGNSFIFKKFSNNKKNSEREEIILKLEEMTSTCRIVVTESGRVTYACYVNRRISTSIKNGKHSMTIIRIVNRLIKKRGEEDDDLLSERVEYLREMEFCHDENQVLRVCIDSHLETKFFRFFFLL